MATAKSSNWFIGSDHGHLHVVRADKSVRVSYTYRDRPAIETAFAKHLDDGVTASLEASEPYAKWARLDLQLRSLHERLSLVGSQERDLVSRRKVIEDTVPDSMQDDLLSLEHDGRELAKVRADIETRIGIVAPAHMRAKAEAQQAVRAESDKFANAYQRVAQAELDGVLDKLVRASEPHLAEYLRLSTTLAAAADSVQRTATVRRLMEKSPQLPQI